MKKIKDNLFFTNKVPLELKYQYEYNQYKENEFTQNDALISILPRENTLDQSSYITLEITKNINYPSNIAENTLIFSEKIQELNSYENLPLHIDRLFNIPENFNSKKSYITLDNDFKDLFLY